jgi:hypothetical protein
VASFDEVIPPGQAGNVTAELDTQKLHGAVGRGITVYTNDPARPKWFLTVRATVVGGVIVLPSETVALHNRDERFRSRKLLVQRASGETDTLAIANLEAGAEWIEVGAERVEEFRRAADGVPPASPGDWIVTVSIADSAPYGSERTAVRFETGVARQPVIELPVIARVGPPVELSEQRLVLPRPGEDRVARRTVSLMVRPGLDPTALEVESEPEALEAELERSGRRGYKLHLAWTTTDTPAGTVTFKVGSERMSVAVEGERGPS